MKSLILISLVKRWTFLFAFLLIFEILIAYDNEPEHGRLDSRRNVTIKFFFVDLQDLRKASELLSRAKEIHTNSVSRTRTDVSRTAKDENESVLSEKDRIVIQFTLDAVVLSLPRYARDLVIGIAYNAEGYRRKSRLKIDQAERAFNLLRMKQPQMKDIFSSFLVDGISSHKAVRPMILVRIYPVCCHRK